MESELPLSTPSAFVYPRWPRRVRRAAAEATPAAAIIVAAGIATCAPWLAGGQVLRGQAVVMFGLAILLAVWPPKSAPHRLAAWALLGTLVLCGAQFLPAAVGGGSVWRAGLAQRLALTLAPSVSPQPWISLDHTLVLLAGLAWWWWCATMLPSRAAREELAKAALLGIAAVGFCALCVLGGVAPRPGWWSEYVAVGPFPNKNQMADLMATWAVVAAGCGVASLQRRRWTAAWWLAVMLLLGWSTVESSSRGGMFVLLAGLAVFALREGLATRQLRPVTIGLSVSLCGVALFLAFGGETLQRSVRLFQAMRESTSSDFRTQIYRDALRLIHDAPWPGLGLGDFEPVFALHRAISQHTPVRILHPESDWLWLAAELGWLAPTFALLFVVPSLRNPLRSALEERSPILDAATIGGVAFLLHGLVDVSGHRMGSALPALLLLGLGIRRKSVTEPRSAWPWFFRSVAVALVALATSWLPFVHTGWGRASIAMAKEQAIAGNSAAAFHEAEAKSTAALRQAPLDWELYFIRAVAELYQKHFEEALTDFRRARQLESADPKGPLEEGRLWAYFDPAHCGEAWEAALARGEVEGRLNIYWQIIEAGRGFPDLYPTMRALAGGDWDRRRVYLTLLPPEAFPQEFPTLLAGDPALQAPSDECVKGLLALWETRGDREQLVRFIQENPRAQRLAWRTLARLKAEDKEFEFAAGLVLAHLQVPVPELSPLPLDAAQMEFARNPQNLVAGYHLFQAQAAAGELEEALVTLKALEGLPNCPPYVFYLRGKLFAERSAWEEAWRQLAPLL